MNKTITKLKAILVASALIFVMMVTLTSSVKAQNIAPLATVNAQGGFNPPWNWNRINDLQYGTCGQQLAFVWTANPPNGSEWMEWEWNKQYPINKIVIDHAQTTSRFLTGGTIQYWDGANWVNHHTFSGLPTVCTNTVTFPLFISDKMRITAFQMTGPNQTSNPNFREIEVWQGAFPGTHARTTTVINDGENCGSTSDSIVVNVQNIGLNRFTDFWVGATATGTVNGTPVSFSDSVMYTGDSVNTAQTIGVKLFNFNSIDGGNLDIVGWCRITNDTNQTDDTARNKVTILGSPTSDPNPQDNDRCGTGEIALTGNAVSGNTVYWYDAPTGGNLVGKGNMFTTPDIPGGTSKTYYASGVKESGDSTHSLGYAGNNFAGAGFMGGNMFNVVVRKPITIDSLHVQLNLANEQEVVFYMKTGTYGNSVTTPGDWTFVDRGKVQAMGNNNPSSFLLSKPVHLEPGNYAFYIFADENLIFETITGSRDVENVALLTSHGIALRDSFATPFGGQFAFNGDIFYHEACIKDARKPAVADAKPLPVGADVAKGATFQGQFVGGAKNQPDIVANPDRIQYSLNPPTGFNNSDFGTTWTIPMLTLQTENGSTVPTTDYTLTNPSSTGNGVLEFKPGTGLTDSLVKVSMVLRRTDNGCDSLVERYIFVAPRPQVAFTTNSACKGDAIEFKNTSSISTGTISYDWDFADGTGSDLANPFHSYFVAGTYNAKLIVTSNYGYKDSITVPVSVFEVPSPDFEITNACEGTAVQFADVSTLPAGTPTYIWNFGDGSPNGTGATTAKTYTNPGIYPVTLTVDVNGCSDKITKYATQAPRSVPSFTVDLGECDNKDVKFTNTTTAPSFGNYSSVWKFGDGSSAAGLNTVHTYNVFNTYDATLVVRTDLGCVDSITNTVSLKESPKADFNISGASCTNESVDFNNTTNVPSGSTNTYEWEFGDANGSTLDNPSHMYPSEGTYTISLKATSTNGCESSKSQTVNIQEKPVSDFTVNKVCEGEETVFTNNSTTSSSTLSYQWDLGNGSTPTSADVKETYASAGSYNVSLVATSTNGCTDTSTKTAVVGAIPPVDINIASNQTQDGTMLFSTSTTGVTYKWFFGDGGTSDQQNPTYQFKFATRYTVRLVVTNADGCSNSTTAEISINPLSVGTINGNSWSIYPNPSAGKFFIKYDGLDIATIKVSDMLGKTITALTPEFNNGEFAFDLTNQSAGVYIVTLTDVNGNTSTQKVTVSK
jgi:PKD repeat protein